MADVDPTILIEDAALRRVLPFKRFEYVDVTFQKANTDTVIHYSILRPNDVNTIRWMDVAPTTVISGSTESPVTSAVYCPWHCSTTSLSRPATSAGNR